MNPYYQDDSVTIYHGDCLDVLPALDAEVRAVVMDPPYSSGTRKEAGRSASGAMMRGERFASRPIHNDQMTTPGFVWLIRQALQSVTVSKGGSVLSFIDWRQWPNLLGAVESLNYRVNNMVVWDKLSMGMGNGFRNQHELVMYASNGTPNVAARDTGNVLRAKRERPDEHPSPKPVSLIEALIRVVAEPGSLVADPFMGCGTLCVAARNLGIRAIGIEINERYCEIAAQRMAQQSLFGAL